MVASASGNIYLGTKVGFITANTSASGSAITLTEADDVTLTQVTTVNGAFQVSAGGTVTAENVTSGTGNITVAVTGGDIVSGAADCECGRYCCNES